MAESLTGLKLGEYEVRELLGEGGMSDVYAGFQPNISKKVAIKVLKPEMAADQSHVARLLTEAVAVNTIGHRNVIDIFASGNLPDGRPYIVMEFLEGESLDTYLEKVPLLQQLEAIEVLIDILGPLAAAHAKGIIHRDLKPSNVFLLRQPDGTRFLKLLDFGLAKQSYAMDNKARQTSQYQVAGTPDYMAPEQAQGKDISPLTDLYAVGVMAFQLLTGRLPFIGRTPMEVMLKQVNDVPPRLRLLTPEILPALEQLVLQLLEKEPSKRPPTAEVVRAELKLIGMSLRTEEGVETRVWTQVQTAPPLSNAPAQTPMSGRPLTQNSAEGLMALITTPSSSDLPRVVSQEPHAPLDPSFLTTDLSASPVAKPAATATPEPAAEPPKPAAPKPSSRLPLMVGGAVAVLAALAVFIWSQRKEPPKPVVEPPPPPVVAIPPPATVEVQPPAPPPVAEVKPPEPAPAPTVAELKERVLGLERRVKELPAKARTPAKQFLAREQKKLAGSTEEQRRELSQTLDAWESKHLKK
ncbi:MAG: serine/threonine-protein kinase [Myxococcaceae bacterium]